MYIFATLIKVEDSIYYRYFCDRVINGELKEFGEGLFGSSENREPFKASKAEAFKAAIVSGKFCNDYKLCQSQIRPDLVVIESLRVRVCPF